MDNNCDMFLKFSFKTVETSFPNRYVLSRVFYMWHARGTSAIVPSPPPSSYTLRTPQERRNKASREASESSGDVRASVLRLVPFPV